MAPRAKTKAGRAAYDKSEEALAEAIAQASTKNIELQKRLKDNNLTDAQRAQLEEQRGKLQDFVNQGDAGMPQSALVKNSASDYYRGRGDLKRSAELAEQGLAHASPDGDPKLTSNLLTNRGLSRYSQGSFEESYSDGKIAHELDPENKAALELYRYSESALRAQYLPGEVKEHIGRMIALTDASVPHNSDEWVKNYEKNPTREAGLTLEAMMHYSKGDLAGALGVADAAVKASPEDPFARFIRGKIQRSLKNFNEVVIDMGHAINKGWQDPELFTLRAEASYFGSLGRKDISKSRRKTHLRSTLADAEMAISISTADAKAYLVRGVSKFELKYPAQEVLADIRAGRARDLRIAPIYESIVALIENKLAPADELPAAAAPLQIERDIPYDWREPAAKIFFGFSALVFLGALYKRLRAS